MFHRFDLANTETRAVLIVGAICVLVQVVSATIQERSFETPNAATWIARTLAESGEFANGGLRAYHLPGEPVYLATGFALFPERSWRYLHVPVVTMFVIAIAFVALAIGGPPLALAAGLAATLDPYVVRHGPTWDDTFLAAALEWCIFAVLVALGAKPGGRARPGTIALSVVAAAAALAAVTRSHSQLVLVSIAVAAIGLQRLRAIRAIGFAMLFGVVLALGAWGFRNSLVLGSFFVGSTRDGKALFESNCAYTRQGIRELGVVGGFMHDCSEAQVTHALGLGELESNRELGRYALQYIASNPLDVAKTAVFKLLVSLSGYSFASPALSIRNAVAVASSLVTLSLGLCGLVHLRRRMPSSVLRHILLLIGGTTTGFTILMLAVGPTGLRYRISFAGFLYLGLAAIVVDRMPRAWTAWQRAGATPIDAVGS